MTLPPLVEPNLDNELTAPYWEGFQDEEVRLPRCEDCGEFHWYPRRHCPHCLSENLTWTATSGTVELFSWVGVIHDFDLPFLTNEVPVYIGMIVPEEDDGIRLIGVLDADPTALQVGISMNPTFVENEEFGLAAPVFRPR